MVCVWIYIYVWTRVQVTTEVLDSISAHAKPETTLYCVSSWAHSSLKERSGLEARGRYTWGFMPGSDLS